MWSYRNIMPGFGSPPDGDPPPGLDYDLWLGPAPKRPYNPNRSIYHFRWFWDYSGGQMTNLAHHSLDIVHWYLGATAPAGRHQQRRPVRAPGQRRDARHAGRPARVRRLDRDLVAPRGQPRRRADPGPGVLRHRGEPHDLAEGLHASRGTRRSIPSRPCPGSAAHTRWAGRPRRDWTTRGSPGIRVVEDRSGDEFDQFRRHARNFLDCVRSRSQPVSDLETGHRVSTACHLANLSLRLGRKLKWDAERETVLGDPEAAALLERPYRAPWDRLKEALLRTV